MITSIAIFVAIVVGIGTGFLTRIGFAETTPERYRRRWGRPPLVAAIAVTICFVFSAGVFAYTLSVGPDLSRDGPAILLFPWATAGLGVGLPSAWRLVARDVRERHQR